jgi:16S rRNA (adenine1518-N6/adenine1519-N6)-dimethyltransferase
LGQHFLHDERIVARIVASAGIEPATTVLEIGPGLGIMTRQLAAVAGQVIAVEKDHRLAELLAQTVPANVTIVEADALEIDPVALAGRDYVVVANLPYSVGNAVLRRVLESDPPPKSLTVMVQREVAERIVARPPQMSILAVAVQFFGDARLLFRVGRGAFNPPPNVESAILRIETRPPPLTRCKFAPFFDVVRAGFGQRRKQLANALAGNLGIARERENEALAEAQLRATVRAEELDVAQWVALYQALARPAGVS